MYFIQNNQMYYLIWLTIVEMELIFALQNYKLEKVGIYMNFKY